MSVDTYIQLPTDGSGKKTRTLTNLIGVDTVHSQVTVIGDPTGSGLVGASYGALRVDTAAISGLNVFGQDINVVSTVDTTLLTYTVPATNSANIEGFIGTGSATGRFKLKIDGTVKAVTRTSAAVRCSQIDFGKGTIKANAGQVITIVGYHEELANQTLECSVYGFLSA